MLAPVFASMIASSISDGRNCALRGRSAEKQASAVLSVPAALA
jgi:hypothetical protein